MNTEVTIDGKVYKVEDLIAWTDRHGDTHIGIIKFGIYEDDEQYTTHNHIGYYVEFEYTDGKLTKETLIDIIRGDT